MNREERQRLLHEGTSTSATLSAFVEIVFDSESAASRFADLSWLMQGRLGWPLPNKSAGDAAAPHHWPEKGRVLA